MAWKGITNNQTDVGAGQLTIENSSYYVKGELQRRLGFGARIAQIGIAIAEQGSYLLYVTAGGAIVAHDGTTPSTLTTGYNVVYRPCLTQALGRMYFVNDFDAMMVSDDGMTIRTAGIVAPSSPLSPPASSAGSIDLGTHYIRYRWYDSRRQRYSDPSDAISMFITSTTKTLTVTNIVSGDSTVDTIIYEMTPADDGTYYQVTTAVNTAGTTALSISDANLVNQTAASLYGDFGHVPPPLAKILCEHETYFFLWGATSRTFSSCTITNGSPTITGTGFSTQWAGRQVTIAGYTATYYVSTATTTVITLTANFVGTSSGAATITVASGNPYLLCWSQPGQPESYDTTELARIISMAAGDSPTAMLSLHGDLYLIGARSMRRMNMSGSGPADAQIIAVPSTLGAFHQRCVVSDAGNMAFGWGRDGMWMIDAMLPQRISDPIITTVNSLIDASRTEERFVVWEPTTRVALFFFCLSGETACKAAAAYSVDSQTWQIWKYRQPMVCGCPNNYTDQARLALVDSNASTWRVGVKTNDGADAGVVTAAIGSTTTVVQGPTAIVGQVVYRPGTDEERYVTAITVGSFTVGVAFATAPTAGERLYLGSVRQRIVLEWFVADGIINEKRPRYLLLAFRPQATNGTLKVYLYKDFSTTAVSTTSSQSDLWPDGCQPVAGSNYITVDLDNAEVLEAGFISIPVFSDWSRAISAEIIADQPYDTLRFLDVSWSITGKPEEAEVEGE